MTQGLSRRRSAWSGSAAFGNDDQTWQVIFRARPGEGGSRIARGSDHQDAGIVSGNSRQHAANLQFFEGGGLERCAALGPVATKGDPKMRQPESRTQTLALIRDGTGRIRQSIRVRQPALIAVDARGVRVAFERAGGVAGREQSGSVRTRTVEREAIIVELESRTPGKPAYRSSDFLPPMDGLGRGQKWNERAKRAARH